MAFFIDQWKPGSGTENQLQGLLKNFDPDLVEASLFTLKPGPDDSVFEDFPCPVTCLDVPRLLSLAGIGRLLTTIPALRRQKFDVAMIYFIDSNLFAVPACRMAGVHSVVINRRDMGYWYEPGILNKLNFVNRQADYFLANSNAVKKRVEACEGFPADRIHVIHNGNWENGANRTGEHTPFGDGPPDSLLVGMTASLREVKRVDRFLDMAAAVSREISQVRFVVAGQGHLLPKLKEQAADLGLEGRVYFPGQVSDVSGLLAQWDVGVLTSESEGLSNSLMEYSLSGLPVVTFDTGGNGEVVSQGKTGYLVPEGDLDAMTARVVELLRDEALRKKMGDAGRIHCQNSFSPNLIIDRMMTFLEGITSSTRRGYSIPLSRPIKKAAP